jgi:peptide/nickel transport system ATP-binding protein
MTDPLLQTRNLTQTYRVSAGAFKGKLPLKAVDRVDLDLEKGAVLGLVGESGCGKSTVARMLLGLEAPTDGEILLEGRPIADIGRKALARRIQPVFQDPYASLNPRKSIESIISLPLRVHAIGDAAERADAVARIMEIVGLPPRFRTSYPNQLSGGQRQRVAIARALIMRPEIVICDEPTSALDVSVQSQILNLLLDLRGEFGLTYLLITHDLAVVEHLATRVAVMYLGRIVEKAPTEALFSGPAHPYTRILLDSVLTPEPHLGLPDTHLGTAYPNPIDPPPGCTFHPRCPRADALCETTPPELIDRGGRSAACHHPLTEAD